MPDTGERLTRKGFIGLGAVEDYQQGPCTGTSRRSPVPKRIAVSCCEAHAGPFRPDLHAVRGSGMPHRCAARRGRARRTDCVGHRRVRHDAHAVSDLGPEKIRAIQQLMADKKLLIADGHHRYETALAVQQGPPGNRGCEVGDDDLREYALAGAADSRHPSRRRRPAVSSIPTRSSAKLGQAFKFRSTTPSVH